MGGGTDNLFIWFFHSFIYLSNILSIYPIYKSATLFVCLFTLCLLCRYAICRISFCSGFLLFWLSHAMDNGISSACVRQHSTSYSIVCLSCLVFCLFAFFCPLKCVCLSASFTPYLSVLEFLFLDSPPPTRQYFWPQILFLSHPHGQGHLFSSSISPAGESGRSGTIFSSAR